jgi:hypothetical protein
MSDDVCRLCLRTDDLSWVFDENVLSNMAEMIRAICGVEVRTINVVMSTVENFSQRANQNGRIEKFWWGGENGEGICLALSKSGFYFLIIVKAALDQGINWQHVALV